MPHWLIEEVVVLVVFGAVLVTIIRQLGAHLRAKAQLTQETAFRTLGERSVATQEATQRSLAEISVRMAKIERVLQEVE